MTIVNGTHYNPATPDEVIEILERFRQAFEQARRGGPDVPNRIRVHYGDVETGQDWGDIYNVSGYVSRSMGPVCIPILLSNRSSTGGGGLLEACIVRIRYANRNEGGDIYRHPNYTPPAREQYPRKGEWERNFS